MNQEERARFEAADQRVHSVESQWHHPIMVKHGFVPQTKEAVGFVRSYEYEHPDGRRFVITTGASSDHWKDPQTLKTGYWSDLDPYLERCKPTTI